VRERNERRKLINRDASAIFDDQRKHGAENERTRAEHYSRDSRTRMWHEAILFLTCIPREILFSEAQSLTAVRAIHKLNVSRLTVTIRQKVSVPGMTAAATAAAPRRISMADDDHRVSGGATATVAAVATTSAASTATAAATTATPVFVVPSSPLLVTVVTLRARRAVVSGAHWCTCTLRTFRPLVRSISSAVATQVVPSLGKSLRICSPFPVLIILGRMNWLPLISF